MNGETQKGKMSAKAKSVIVVVVMFGLISCFGDIIYEGGRSANGQYLSLLAVNATTLGVVYGFGEFLGYALRLFSGRLSDKTGKHWTMIFLGYGTLFVVPLMGLVPSLNLPVSATHGILYALLLIERCGKALRNPPKDTILSQVAESHVGTGFVFGLQEALDQLGAFAGPLVFTVVLTSTGRTDVGAYQIGYGVLAFGFILVMGMVFIAWRRVSKYDLTRDETIHRGEDRLTGTFWIYCVFAFFSTLGFLAWPVIALRLMQDNVIPDAQITAFYSIAHVVDAILAMIIGKIYDVIKKKRNNKKAGLLTLCFIPFATVSIPFLMLLTNSYAGIITGVAMTGIVMGAHETIMRSAIADVTSFKKRGTAFGIFNCFYGGALFIGAAAAGFLYDRSGSMMICILTVVVEVIALALFFVMRNSVNKGDHDVTGGPTPAVENK